MQRSPCPRTAGKTNGGGCRSVWRAMGGIAFGGRSRTTACSCQRRNDAKACGCVQVSHQLFPELAPGSGAYEPSCDLQRAPRGGGGASLRRGGSRILYASAIWSFIESERGQPRAVVGRSAAPERPGRPGSGPTVQHGHWGSQVRFIDETTRLSEARQAATRAARASKWLDLF